MLVSLMPTKSAPHRVDYLRTGPSQTKILSIKKERNTIIGFAGLQKCYKIYFSALKKKNPPRKRIIAIVEDKTSKTHLTMVKQYYVVLLVLS